jgi:hypothetical protein
MYPLFQQRATHHGIDSLASNHDNPFGRFWQCYGLSRNMSPQSEDINTEIKIPLIFFIGEMRIPFKSLHTIERVVV